MSKRNNPKVRAKFKSFRDKISKRVPDITGTEISTVWNKWWFTPNSKKISIDDSISQFIKERTVVRK